MEVSSSSFLGLTTKCECNRMRVILFYFLYTIYQCSGALYCMHIVCWQRAALYEWMVRFFPTTTSTTTTTTTTDICTHIMYIQMRNKFVETKEKQPFSSWLFIRLFCTIHFTLSWRFQLGMWFMF